MRSEAIFCSSLYILLFVVVTLEKVQSFQTNHLKFDSITRNRYHHPTATGHNDRDLSKLVLMSSQLPSALREIVIRDHPWYSHPEIGRDRSHVLNRYNSVSDILNRYEEEKNGGLSGDDEGQNDGDAEASVVENSKFLLISSDGMWHRKSSSSASIVSPLYLTINQLDGVIEVLSHIEEEPLIVWVGKYENEDYWVVKLNDHTEEGSKAKLESILLDSYSSESGDTEVLLDCKPLREFGDSLQDSLDAGISATANGLVEFHKSHGYCSFCGGPTKSTKAGASRTCTNEDCRKSVYPRIDSAAIMLVTSPCESYALLGRKRSWPSGRYSTLAGFCEVGETLEECCQRETYEESGVVIDPRSVRFVASQPWPFPRSLMVGFRAKAMSSSEAEPLPEIIVDTNEMEDIRWFDKDFVKESLKLSGSTALTFQPSEVESEFHVPGKASLARFLIKEWVDEKGEHNK